jgi:hypothetical protein
MRHKHFAYIVCLSVSEGTQRSLFAPTDFRKMSCNIQQLSFHMAIANLSYYLPTIQDGQFRTSDTVSCSVTICDVSKSLPHGRSLFCFTVRTVVLNKQLSNKHIFTALPYIPMYQRTICQYTHQTQLPVSCPLMY